MKLDQIIIRPEASRLLIQHTDNAGRSGVTIVEFGALNPGQSQALGACLDFCQDAMPVEPDKPVADEVEQEIAELEYRLEHLRKALGKVSKENKSIAP